MQWLHYHNPKTSVPKLTRPFLLGGTEKVILNSNIPVKDMAPNTPAKTQVSVTGETSGYL